MSTYTLLLFIVVLATFIYFPEKQKQQVTEALEVKAEGTVQILAIGISLALDEGDYDLIQKVFSLTQADTNIAYIAVLDEIGDEIISFNPKGIQTPNTIRYSQKMVLEEKEMIFVTKRLLIEDEIYSNLVIGYSLKGRNETIAQIRWTGLWLSLAIFLLGTLISVYISRQITNPLQNVVETFKEMGRAGTYGQMVEKRSTDEIGSLIDGFNEMSAKIHARTEELHESEEKYRQLIERSNDIVFTADRAGHFTFVNPIGLKIAGYSKKKVFSMHFNDLVHPDYRKETRKFYSYQIKNKLKNTYYEYPIVTKKGKTVWLGQNLQLLTDNGRISGVQAVARDITDRKEMEDALLKAKDELEERVLERTQELYESNKELSESRERLDSLMEKMPDGLEVTIDGKIVFSNQANTEIFGYERNELLNRAVIDFIHPEDRKQAVERIRTLMKGGGEQHTQYRMIRKDGSVFPAEVYSCIFEYDGKRALLSVMRDITESLQAMEALQKSEKRFRSVWENSLDGMRLTDENGIIIAVNKAFCKMVKMNEGELSGHLLTDAYSVEDKGKSLQKYENRFRNRRVKPYMERKLTICTGKKIDVALTNSFIDFEDGESLLLSIFRDITETVWAEGELDRILAQTEQLLASIPGILIGVDAETKVTSWNVAAAKAFDIAPIKALTKFYEDIDIKWDREKVKTCISDCLRDGVSKHINEIRYTNDEGKDRFLSITINPIKEDLKTISGFLIHGRDVTERKILESQLAQAQKLESIGQLAAGIAHEMNTPIQYVGDNTGFLEESFQEIFRLLRKYESLRVAAQKGSITDTMLTDLEAEINKSDIEYFSEEIPKAIVQSLEGIDRVAKIVQAMKDFSHPGKKNKILTDLNKAIETTITVTRNEWKYIANMKTEFDRDLPLIPLMPNDFNQVILNLIINAAHAMAATERSGNGRKQSIRIVTRRDGNWVEIRITDTGIGIPEEVRNKVFDPFFTTKEVGRGTGQGLAIAHTTIVEKHGGTIAFESETGKGTTFTIRLPMNNEVESEK